MDSAKDPALELVLDPTLEPTLDPAEVASDLPRAANLVKDGVLEPAFYPLDFASDLPAKIVASDLSAELVAISLYHLQALSSSDWNGFFVTYVDDVKEQFFKNGGKPIKICYLSSLDEDQKEPIILYCQASNVEHEHIGDTKME
jgi:hypothetical protein